MWLTCEVDPVRIALFPKTRLSAWLGKIYCVGESRPPQPCRMQNHTRSPKNKINPTISACSSNPLLRSLFYYCIFFSPTPHSCMLQLISFQWYFLEPAYIIAASPERYVASDSVLARFFMLPVPCSSLYSGFYSTTSFILHCRCSGSQVTSQRKSH